MYRTGIDPPWDLAAWREQARAAWCAGIAPDALAWGGDAQQGLMLGGTLADATQIRDAPRVSADFLGLAGSVLCHRDPQRHALLYRLLWRIANGERQLLERATDADVHRARELEKSVRRDSHKMKAFVRFREVPGETDAFVAWFEPDHHIVDRVAPFFARRFAGMRWAILTPYRSVRWNGQALEFGDGGQRGDAPADDAQEDLWRTYYANIFNPARLNPTMMRQEMPQKYWKLLPEAQLLPGLIREAGERVRTMAERVPEPPRRRIPAPPPMPMPMPMPMPEAVAVAEADLPTPDLTSVRAAALACRRCPLWQPATQTVFGSGPADARVMLIGEQPGDEEDLSGRPFVGPAGRLLDRALAELGIDRSALYLTNAVKHFRFEQRGKRRIHKNPEKLHMQACAEWLDRERFLVKPAIVVALGATAAQVLFGHSFRLLQERGRWQTLDDGSRAFATVHPAWVLRQADAASREESYRTLVNDLRLLLNGGATVQDDGIGDVRG